MKKYTHIIFDLDRTLWDFEGVSHEIISELFAEYVKPLTSFSFEYFYDKYLVINSGLWDLYRNNEIKKELLRVKRFSLTLEELGINRPWIANKMAEEYVEKTAIRTRLFPETKPIIDYLKGKNYVLSIMTNGFKEVQYPKIERSGLEPFFDYIFISEEIGFNKPDIRIFEYALNKMKISADKAIFVGDDYEVDIIGAANAGIDQVYFNPNIDSCNNRKVATFNICSLLEMKNFL